MKVVYGVVGKLTIVAYFAALAWLFDWICARRPLTKFGRAFFAAVDTFALGTVVVFVPHVVALVHSARLSSTLARAHRTTLGYERLLDFAVQLGTFDFFARYVAHVAATRRTRVQLPFGVVRKKFTVQIARKIGRIFKYFQTIKTQFNPFHVIYLFMDVYSFDRKNLVSFIELLDKQ